MYKIIKNEMITKDIYKLVVEAPLIAKKFMPGEFVVVMNNFDSERIPLTISDVYDDYIEIVYQVVGASTLELTKNNSGLYALLGPLGNGSELCKIDLKGSSILFVAGGLGIASIIPQVKLFKSMGANIDIVYGVKNKDSVILVEKIESLVNNLIITSDDGSIGIQGNVLMGIPNTSYDYCITIGPINMMKYVALKTKELNIPTIVSLNPIMVDGTGMCGACRVEVDNKVKFACVDGPEFNAHQVDFDLLIKRNQMYKTEEGRLYLEAIEGKTHHGGCGNCNE